MPASVDEARHLRENRHHTTFMYTFLKLCIHMLESYTSFVDLGPRVKLAKSFIYCISAIKCCGNYLFHHV